MKTAARKQPVKKRKPSLVDKKSQRIIENVHNWLDGEEFITTSTFSYCCGIEEVGGFPESNIFTDDRNSYNNHADREDVASAKQFEEGYKRYIYGMFLGEENKIATLLVKEQAKVITWLRALARKHPGKFTFKNFTNPSTKNDLVLVIYVP